MAAEDKNLLLEQLNHIRSRLLEEGKRVPDEPLVIGYDNGGGQTGVRENPFYPAYEKLLQAYIKTLGAVKDLGGQSEIGPTSLDDIRAMFKVAK